MPATHFTALKLGGNPLALSTALDVGDAAVYQSAVLSQNSTTAVSATINVPKNSRLISFLVDVTTVFNSGTSAILTVGVSAADTTYVTSVDVKAAAGRIAVTFTGAQLLAMENVVNNTAVVATITPTGATSTGRVKFSVHYIPGNN